MEIIHSIELEKYSIAGLIKYPKLFSEVALILSEADFVKDIHKSAFSIIKQLNQRGEDVSFFIVAERLKNLKITFKEIKNINDLLEGYSLISLSEKDVMQTFKDLKRVTVRREIYETARNLAMSMKNDANLTFKDLIQKADNIYHNRISAYEIYNDVIDIYSDAEDIISSIEPEATDKFMLGPHSKLNDIYGSLYRPGNISVICARSGSFKTAWMIDYADKVAARYNVPVLHLDNGEMSEEEIRFRRISSLSGVPVYFLETGEYKKNKDLLDKVQAAWAIIKNRKFYYYNVGGMDISQICSVIKNFYYSKVGRFNEKHKFVLNFDYIKISQGSRDRQEYQIAGDMMIELKNLLSKEVPVGMLTALQANRSGIVTNKTEDQVLDDESIAGMSDRIIQNCSHFFILRRKTNDQLSRENQEFGSLMLKALKCRHFGKDRARHFNLVEFNEKLVQNYINFDVDNFNMTEVGDFMDAAERIGQIDIDITREDEGSPFDA